MLPHHIILWSETPETLRKLRRISAFHVIGGESSSGTERWTSPDLLGFTYYRENGRGEEERANEYIGTFGPVPYQAQEWTEEGWWDDKKWVDDNGKRVKPLNPSDLNLAGIFEPFDEKCMLHFEVDGAGGEEVTEIHVSGDFKAVKLKTNKARECYWGEERRTQWYVKVANDVEYIAGLSVCFGRLGGFSWRSKMHSHWELSELGVVMARRDGGLWQQT